MQQWRCLCFQIISKWAYAQVQTHSLSREQQMLGAGMALHCQTLQGHWGEEDVLLQILSQPRCKTGQRKAVLALRHYFQHLWHTLLPPQMLVGSSCKTSLKELGYLTPARAGGGHQNKAGSKESLPALNHRDQQEPELQTHLYLGFSSWLL